MNEWGLAMESSLCLGYKNEWGLAMESKLSLSLFLFSVLSLRKGLPLFLFQ